MKINIALIISLLILIGCKPQIEVSNLVSLASSGNNCQSLGYAGGEGTQNCPYEIKTPAQLKILTETRTDWDAYFILSNNIDLSGFDNSNLSLSLGSIGTYNSATTSCDPFTGSFNGQGFEIQNLTLVPIGGLFQSVSLFGCVRDANIQNIVFRSSNITGLAYSSVLSSYSIDSTFSAISIYDSSINGAGLEKSGFITGYGKNINITEVILDNIDINCTQAWVCGGFYGGIAGHLEYDSIGEDFSLSNFNIQDLTINTLAGDQISGLSGELKITDSNITIQDISISNISITGPGDTIGGLVAYFSLENTRTLIQNINISGAMQFCCFSGGLVGKFIDTSGTSDINIENIDLDITISHSSQKNGSIFGILDVSTPTVMELDNLSSNTVFNCTDPTGSCSNIGGLAGDLIGNTTYNISNFFNKVEFSYITDLGINIGGLIGQSGSAGNPTTNFTNVYSEATFTILTPNNPNYRAAGVGRSRAQVNYNNVYWLDNSSTLQIAGDDASTIGSITNAQKYQQSTYSGFDFTSVWKMSSGDFPEVNLQ